METCRHFRFQVPREVADELRDADPGPCPVCDTLPHRRQRTGIPCPQLQLSANAVPTPVRNNWFRQLLARVRFPVHQSRRGAA